MNIKKTIIKYNYKLKHLILMRIIKIIIKLLISFKFEILKPTYKKILIFDNTNSDLIKKYFKTKRQHK